MICVIKKYFIIIFSCVFMLNNYIYIYIEYTLIKLLDAYSIK